MCTTPSLPIQALPTRICSSSSGPIRRNAVNKWSPSTVVIAPLSPSLARYTNSGCPGVTELPSISHSLPSV
ncbi:hypothetical protein D3C79_920140 [compost metagenome]